MKDNFVVTIAGGGSTYTPGIVDDVTGKYVALSPAGDPSVRQPSPASEDSSATPAPSWWLNASHR